MKRKFGIPGLALVVALSSISAVALPSAAIADGSHGFESSFFFGNQPYYNNGYADNPYYIGFNHGHHGHHGHH